MDSITDLVVKRNEVKRELQNLTQELSDTETEIKQELISHGCYECLTIRWDRVNRMCRE